MDKKKLNSGAKAFIPQYLLNKGAEPWTPPKSSSKSSADKEKDTKNSKKIDTTKKSSTNTTTTTTTTTSSSTQEKKQAKKEVKPNNDKSSSQTKPTPVSTSAPATAPAPAPPKPSVWGKKPINAILAAPTPNQQSAQQSQPQNQNQQMRKSSSHRPNYKNNENDNDNKNSGGKQQPQQWRNQKNTNHNDKNNDGGGSWRNQKKGNDREDGNGGGRHNNHHHQKNNNNNNKQRDENGSGDGWSRGASLPLELLKPNEGKNESEKSVTRIAVEELLSLRLSFVSTPLSWGSSGGADNGADGDNSEADTNTDTDGPPQECRWISDTRLQEIDSMTNSKRLGGDVSFRKKKKQEIETAPALEDCKPLEKNEDTRWKAGVFKAKDGKGSSGIEGEEKEMDSDKDILRKSLLILNKLSLTKFDKLSDAFIDTGIGRNSNCLEGAIELIVKKAQDEPHFAAMYAALCLKLSRTPMAFEEPGKKKKFKKMLLTECQKEFEQETEAEIAKAIEGIENEEDRQNKLILIKKHYLGHMRFIGELYKGDLISIKIMLMCLPMLLEGELPSPDKEESGGVDEEKVECFAKLMTVIGSNLEQQSLSMKNAGKVDAFEKLNDCWKTVKGMASKTKDDGPKVTNRIKFMLQDLLEMRDNGWVQRREEESAKTIAQIHKDAAKEAKRSSSSSNLNRSVSSSNIRRQSSSNDVRSIARSSSKPNVDSEGFTEIGSGTGRAGGFGRSQSLGNFARTDSRTNIKKTERSSRASSSGGSFAAFNKVTPSSTKKDASQKSKPPKHVLPDVDEVEKVAYKSPDECATKAKNYLKEYFVGGDTDDIVLSIHELIVAGSKGSIDRGSKVLESGILMVLEMKVENVDKFLTVITRCIDEGKIEPPSIIAGLNDPLEFLADIAIDAPLATSHLVTIIGKFIEKGALPFDFLLNTPTFFRSDGEAAQLGCKILKKIGGDSCSSEANIVIIEKLMTDSDKESFPSGAKEMLC